MVVIAVEVVEPTVVYLIPLLPPVVQMSVPLLVTADRIVTPLNVLRLVDVFTIPSALTRPIVHFTVELADVLTPARPGVASYPAKARNLPSGDRDK